jgi:hypothetical protein
MSPELINILVGLLGAGIGSFVTYWLTRDKHLAEVENLKAQTEKIKAEVEALRKSRSAQEEEKGILSKELITLIEPVPIFTKGESRLSTSKTPNGLIVNFSNERTWSGVALKFRSKFDVQEFTSMKITATATHEFTFRIEYKIRVGDESKIIAHSDFHSFPEATFGSTLSIPLRYDGAVDEICVMFYEKGEASYITMQSMRLSK